jgi:hypothetical protein
MIISSLFLAPNNSSMLKMRLQGRWQPCELVGDVGVSFQSNWHNAWIRVLCCTDPKLRAIFMQVVPRV